MRTDGERGMATAWFLACVFLALHAHMHAGASLSKCSVTIFTSLRPGCGFCSACSRFFSFCFLRSIRRCAVCSLPRRFPMAPLTVAPLKRARAVASHGCAAEQGGWPQTAAHVLCPCLWWPVPMHMRHMVNTSNGNPAFFTDCDQWL